MSHSIANLDFNLDEAYAFAKDLALTAGQLLLDSLEARRNGSSPSQVSSVEKENAVDIVTKTDETVEQYIHSRISAAYPAHDFIGEETYSATAGSTKPYLIRPETPAWCVDPLDGTVNYVHCFPAFAVSIALVVQGRPIIGAISVPFNNQLFHACAGRGAWLSSIVPSITSTTATGSASPSTPSCTPTLSRTLRLPLLSTPVPPLPLSAPTGCLFAFEWGKDRRESPTGNLARKVDSFVTMASEPSARGGRGGMVHGMRSLGSATLDLAYTAMGAFDIWWEGGCWEWDVAAGIAILEEAGGLVTAASPSESEKIERAKLGGRSYLAIRPVGGNEAGESGRAQQERCVREVWRRVERLDYSRPGA